MEQATLAERISLIIDELGIKQNEFAKELGVTPNYISMLSHGKKEVVSPTVALLIEVKYGYCANWILTGKGSVMSRDSYIKKLYDKIKTLSEENLVKVDLYLKSL